ncbi:MAG: antitoxin [Bacteroidetes bacterium]|nr:antitoxin [Bacteroidota bacterium]
MALQIKNKEADELARDLAELTGESLTEAVVQSLRERLQREQGRMRGAQLREEVKRIQDRVARLPVQDPQSPDAIIGYDNQGLPQ